ncbi:MAG: helicase, partial [Pseudonocardia sp.]|nr:helicase [Pseudonocardia sp.]
MQQRRGLVMVSDPELLDAILRLGAAAGCELERAVDATAARRLWADAPVVLLDAPAA